METKPRRRIIWSFGIGFLFLIGLIVYQNWTVILVKYHLSILRKHCLEDDRLAREPMENALTDLGEPAVPHLINALQEGWHDTDLEPDQHARFIQSVAYSLSFMDDTVIPHLVSALYHEKESVRLGAVYALYMMSLGEHSETFQSTEPDIRKLVKDKSRHVERLAKDTLKNLEKQREALKDEKKKSAE